LVWYAKNIVYTEVKIGNFISDSALTCRHYWCCHCCYVLSV